MKKLHVILLLAFSISLSAFNCSAQFTILHNFVGYPDGSDPAGGLTLSGNVLYGMTENGGANYDGCIFSVDTDGTNYKDIFDFNGTNGEYPYGSLMLSGGKLYGMTSQGGTGLLGVAFSINTNGTGYTILNNFAGYTTGADPLGGLTLIGNVLYGMTASGGPNTYGDIFSINSTGGGFRELFGCAASNGDTCLSPIGNLALSGNKFYAMSTNGGPTLNGNMFSIDTNGSGYKNLLNFNTTTGELTTSSYASLTLSGGKLFGMAYGGGAHGDGTIFSIDTDGSGFKDIFSFDGTNGEAPFGSLIILGNKLYGMTNQGGAHDSGNVFSINTDGSGYKEMYDFGGMYGAFPVAGPLTLSGNMLYGMASHGGSGMYGIVFKLDTSSVASSITEVTVNSAKVSVYPNPAKEYINVQLMNSTKASRVSLYTITGQQVMEVNTEGKQTIQVSTTNLAEGTYLLKVVLADGSSLMSKVVIIK
jgi:uncharacterized repeat protein (TIGR03803 family)